MSVPTMTALRLAIADPPYLGRAVRWYGGGCGNGGATGPGPDNHPHAAEWDNPRAHVELVEMLVREYDGWAIACTPDSLKVYLEAAPDDIRVLAWHRRNAPPSGARVRACWEPVVAYIPPERRARSCGGLAVNDVLDVPAGRTRFAGAKPIEWTTWVLTALGYQDGDDVVDLFPGSGAVSAAIGALLW